MDRTALAESIESLSDFDFSRSGGPGGQNVNKVSTKVMISVPLLRLDGLSEGEKIYLAQRLKKKLNEEGFIVFQVQDTRSQLQNRALAVGRAVEIIEEGLKRDKPRKATKPTRASKQRRLATKKAAGAIKRGRGKPDSGD
jgi:ribosome-associated protein